MELTPERIELLRAIQKKITTFPESYDQLTWVEPNDAAPCGTACCIAGWACLLSGEYITTTGHHSIRSVEDTWIVPVGVAAATLLGLDSDEAETLFTDEPQEMWPIGFANRWANNLDDNDDVGDSAEAAQIASDYIDRIIETKSIY